ncbi:MAG: hypothetical protein IJ943_03720 [Akkermansia sp.]|nr:hypothetical protein [Akkermansia sp.]MBR3387495.1 hypothetical protein [Bacteroidales bacterium]
MTETKPAFAKLTSEQKAYMERIQIGNVFVSTAQVRETKRVFALDNKTTDELRAIRNSVVKYLGDLASVMRYCDNERGYDRALNALSGITGVIDSYLYA